MAKIVLYDSTKSDNRVTHFDPSGNIGDYSGFTDKLIDPDLTGFWTEGAGFLIPLLHWKWDGATGIAEQTETEKENRLKELVSNAPVVRVQEQSDDPTKQVGGKHKALGFNFAVPASTGDHNYDIQVPYNISVLSVEYVPATDMEGDAFSAYIAPDITIGTITSDVSISDTVINVGQSVIDNSYIGAIVKLDDGTNVSNCGYILSVDSGTITVETGSANAHAAATPTSVKLTHEAIKDVTLSGTVVMDIGATKIGSSYIPANAIIRITYHNHSGVAHNFTGVIEYLY